MTVRESIAIHAPIERVFALSTNVELVRRTLRMKPVSGPASVVAGSRVHWTGWKFGLPTSHHTLIAEYEPPYTEADTKRAFFKDMQERGRFKTFFHDHFFTERNGVTTLYDVVHFTLPFGFAGRLVADHIMAPYVARLARTRFAMLKRLAESDGWREFVHLNH